MQDSNYISDEELRKLIADFMIRKEAEKHNNYVEERPYLQIPVPLPPEPININDKGQEGSRVIIIEL
jgi:hypothetical protein|tara:strand:+ start:83 stop:283 length:201 start_codon:yes stop_codon:yes gene_type:complete